MASAPPHTQRDLRDAILTEAAGIIRELGAEALSMREVARRLGVSHQAPYKHFDSRDAILAELTTRALQAFAAKLEGRARGADPYRDLEAIGRAYLDYAAEDPLSYRLMFGASLLDPSAHPEIAEAGRRSFDVLLGAVRRLPRHRGGGPPEGAELDALFAWSTVHGVVSLLQSHAMTVRTLPPDVADRLGAHALVRISQAMGERQG